MLKLRNPMSYHAFLSQVQVLANICPYYVKLLLYQLGFAEKSDLGLTYRSPPNESFSKHCDHHPRRSLHVAVVCTTMWKLADLINGKMLFCRDRHDAYCLTSSGCATFVDGECYHFVFTEISVDTTKVISGNYSCFDIILMQFDSSIGTALEVMNDLGQSLPPLPKLFVSIDQHDEKYDDEVRIARGDANYAEDIDFCLLHRVDKECTSDALDKICTQIARLVIGPRRGVPLSKRKSHILSSQKYGLILITSVIGTMGFLFCISRLKELKVSIAKSFKHFS